MSETDASVRTGCFLCGRPTYDPDKREGYWSRGVVGGRLVLVCPTCQRDRPDWGSALDRCERCGGTRLGVTLGDVICRQCGFAAPRTGGGLDSPDSGA